MAIMYIEDIDVRNLPDWFWDTLREAEGSRIKLNEILMLLPNEKLREHFYFFQAATEAISEEPHTLFMQRPGHSLSEDARDDIASIVVSQGKSYYLAVLNEPKSLADMEEDLIDLGGIADSIYEERTGESFWDELMG
ncbi:MAG: DUF4240 domain-containing protein [Chthonomonadaceae bacterium]|nr:DUF4240 domain-containing protein [Chthonomonadaceae bacterium]